jgi:hypothetical protein
MVIVFLPAKLLPLALNDHLHKSFYTLQRHSTVIDDDKARLIDL